MTQLARARIRRLGRLTRVPATALGIRGIASCRNRHLLIGVLCACLYLSAFCSSAAGDALVQATPDSRLRLAVLGDSDSHAYHDRLSFPSGGTARGGTYRDVTLQWTEVLARLRAEQIDLGPWGVWGTRGLIAELRTWFGLEGRAPRKEDFLYNFAYSGAKCEQLTKGRWRQAQRLVELMDHDTQRWSSGVVVIRIGVNSFARVSDLQRLAHNRKDAEVLTKIAECLGHIERTIALIRTHHPRTLIVVVGIFDDSNIAPNFALWQSPEQLANISAGLDVFDNALRLMARDDQHLTFFDDRQFFRDLWGGRDESGRPSYRRVRIDSKRAVGNTQGDHPRNALLQDKHAGVVWNALWAEALVRLVNSRLGTSIPPITGSEIARLIEPAWPVASP